MELFAQPGNSPSGQIILYINPLYNAAVSRSPAASDLMRKAVTLRKEGDNVWARTNGCLTRLFNDDGAEVNGAANS